MVYTCCDISFPKYYYYIKHLKAHQLKKDLVLQCDICHDYCRGYDNFRKHHTKKHKKDIEKEINESCLIDEPMLTEISMESSNDSLLNNDELTDEVQQYLNMFTAELDSNLEFECKENGNA